MTRIGACGMFRAVFARYHKAIGVLLLAVLFWGAASCALASSFGDNCDHDSDQSQCHCIVHCACHAMSLPSASGDDGLGDFRSSSLVPSSMRVELPLFADSIFNPPKA